MTDNKKVTFLDYEFECLDDYPVGRKVDVVVRPEDIMITEPEEGQITGTITSVIFKGMHYEIIVEDGKNEIVIQNTKFYEAGQKIGMRIGPDEIHVMLPEVLSNKFEGVITYQWNQSREHNQQGQFNFYYNLSKDSVSKSSMFLYMVLLLAVGIFGDLLAELVKALIRMCLL